LQVLNDYNQTHSGFQQDRSGAAYYVVPPNFDQTERELQPWDHRILDNDIARLLRILYKPRPGKDFALSLKETNCNDFFTQPYSEIARNEFGYKSMDDCCALLDSK
jgi:hypothetical protein